MTRRIIKVALHCHSAWSYDASWTLADISTFFGRHGFDAVMMSEHDTGFDPGKWPDFRAECAAASEDGCRLFPGIEYSSPDNDIHILTWGLDTFLAEHRPVAETLQEVAAQNGVAIFAHPVRRDAWRLFDPAWTPLLSGIELWNRKNDGIAPGRMAERLIEETGLPATLGVDFHVIRHYWPLAHHIEVDDDWEKDIVEAIRQGNLDLRVFGRPVLGSNGKTAVPLSRVAESARRRLRQIIGQRRPKPARKAAG